MLASLACAPRRWRAVIGRAASPSEKTARINIIPQVREEVKRALRCARRAPRPRRVPRRVRTVRSWHGIVPFTHLGAGGAYDSHHWTAGIAGRTRRRRGFVATRGARAAAGDAGDWSAPSRLAGGARKPSGSFPQGTERERPHRGPERGHRIPVGA